MKPEAGSRWDFFCPVCQEDLVVPENDRFCGLVLKRGDTDRRVLFSRVAGEKATFVFNDGGLEEHHGSDSDDFLKHMVSFKFRF